MKIGVDLGGTNMRVALVDGDRIVDRKIVPCPARESADVVLERLGDLIAEFVSPAVSGIGLGVPSVVDAENGIVYNVVNIPSWTEVHLKEYLEKRFGIPAEVNNDANCFALGEFLFGAGRGKKDLVGLTLGTGVGSGLILNGSLYNGRNTGAGEVGAIPFRDSDYEHYCSSDFFIREYGISGKEAADRAANGDSHAIGIWNELGRNIGKLIKVVLLAYDPDCIVLGGGISSAFHLFKDSMWQEISDFIYPESLKHLSIEVSELKDVALLGASALTQPLSHTKKTST